MLNSAQPVPVSIQDLFGVWQSVEERVRDRLPLKDLDVCVQNRSTRTVNTVGIELYPFTAISEEKISQYGTVLSRPVLNIFVLKCDDVDAYRNHARQMVRDWYNLVVARPGQQWMVLHVVATEPEYGTSGPARPSGTKFLNIRSSVFDKIKSDFNGASRRDQCVQLRLGDGKPEMTDAIDALLSKMKELIEVGLAERFQIVEQEISKSKANRQTPGWNFCTFFVLQEALALACLSLSLYEDALLQYDELEAIFDDAVADKHLEIFQGHGGFNTQDLTTSIFDVARKPYRELIMENKISTFDFRIYLFSRQADIMVHNRQFADLFSRGLRFVSSISQALEVDRQSHPFFIESWINQAIIAILALMPVQHYDQLTAAAKGDLLVMQRSALVQIIRDLNVHDDKPDEEQSVRDRTRYPYNQGHIHDILCSGVQPTEYLQKVNESILIDYKYSERTFGTSYITAIMATDLYASQDYLAACRLYENLIDISSEESLKILGETNLLCYLNCLERTEQNLKLVQTGLAILASSRSTARTKHAIVHIENACHKIDQSLKASLATCMSTAVSRFARQCDESTSFEISVTLDSFLPSSILANRIQLDLESDSGHRWIFSIDDTEIRPGKQVAIVRTNDYFPGEYQANLVTVRWGQILLEQEFMAAPQRFVIRSDDAPIRVSLIRQRVLHLDRPRHLHLKVSAGDLDVQQCQLRFTSLNDDFRPDISSARVLSTVATAQDSVTQAQEKVLGDLPRKTTLIVEIPYEALATIRTVSASVQLEYTLAGVPCKFGDKVATEIQLPLAVNVQDFFRRDRLFSKFQVLSTNSTPLRLLSCRLASSSTFVAKKPGETCGHLMIHHNPYTQVQEIIPIENADYEPMRLVLRYRQVTEEIQDAIDKCLKSLFHELALSAVTKGILLRKFVHELMGIDIDQSALRGSVVRCIPKEELWLSLQPTLEIRDREATLSLLNSFYDAEALVLAQKKSEILDYYMEIPVDIPNNVVVHTANIDIASKLLSLGSACIARLHISNSALWSKDPETTTNTFSYEIEIDETCWIAVGKTSGEFNLEDHVDAEFHVIPLKPGLLTYPSVDIQAVDGTMTSEIHLRSANLEVLVEGHDIRRTIQL